VGKAVEMFVTSMKWREQVGADTVLETFPKNELYQKLVNYWPGSLYHMDPYTFDGSPVLYESLGRADPKMLDTFGMDNFMQFHIHGMEMLQKKYFEITAEKGYFTGFVVIQDLGDVGWNSVSQTVLKALQTIVSINQSNYPDTLRKMYMVNTPTAVNMIWKAAKLWFDTRTLAKFEFISGGPEVYREIFRNIIPEKDLPKRLGGTSTVDIPLGGPLTQSDENGYISIDIGRGGSEEKIIKVDKGDVLNWQFKSKEYDISYAVYYASQEGGERVDVIPTTRVDSNRQAVEGSVIVENPGIYIFVWDNTYSWTKGKTVLYRITKNSNPV